MSRQTASVLDPQAHELAVGDEQSGRLSLLDHHCPLARIGAEPGEVAVGASLGGAGELVASAVTEAEGVEHVVPVRAGQLEGHALSVHPLAVRVLGIVSPPEGQKWDILDVADVIAFVHERCRA